MFTFSPEAPIAFGTQRAPGAGDAYCFGGGGDSSSQELHAGDGFVAVGEEWQRGFRAGGGARAVSLQRGEDGARALPDGAANRGSDRDAAELGLPPAVLNLCSHDKGFFLVTGQTGSARARRCQPGGSNHGAAVGEGDHV